MYDFTKTKFLSLPFKRQHKKCAELLRFIYLQYIDQKEPLKEWQIYQQFLEWMQEPESLNFTLKTLADRYHLHREKAEIFKKEHHLLPEVRTGDRNTSEEAWPIAIYLDHLRSAHNIGSIIRTVEAFALGQIYFSPHMPSVDHKQIQDAAMGAAKWVTCQQGTPLSVLPHPLIVLETSPQAISLFEFDFPPVFTVAVGNEEYGCSDETLSKADHLIEIPLRGHKNSLNVANAFAIVAGEISKQKSLKQ